MSERFGGALTAGDLLGRALLVVVKLVLAALIQVELGDLEPVLLLGALELGALGLEKLGGTGVLVLVLGRLSAVCQLIVLGGRPAFY